MKGGRNYDNVTPMDDGSGRRGLGLCETVLAGLRFLERGSGSVRRQLPDGAFAVGPPDSKIRMSETTEADPYVSLVKRLALDGKLEFDTAKLLISTYRENASEKGKP